MYLIRLNFLGLGLVTLNLAACATQRPTGTQRTRIEQVAVVTVEALDVPHRLVTVRGSSGVPMTLYVDRTNKHFPQFGVSDQVRIRYVESLAIRLASSGETPGTIKVREETSRPRSGRPAAGAGVAVTAIVRIEEVTADGSVVAFTGPRGRRTMRVNDPGMQEFVRQLHPGDHVEATYEEALALSVEKMGA